MKDWEMIMMSLMCGCAITALLIFCVGDIYYRANSAAQNVEMELEISDKKIKTHTRIQRSGKVSVPITDRDYFICCGDLSIEVDSILFNKLNIGDKVIIVKESLYFKDNAEPWHISYSFKTKK